VQEIPEDLLGKRHITAPDILKVIAGAAAIFIASYFLVEEAVYFADRLGVPSSLIGLLLLSIGTNVPELVVAAQAIFKKHKDIAFGDYLGSAVANTAIFGFLALANGIFLLEAQGFFVTMLIMLVGLSLFYYFARSGRKISYQEGWTLLLFYILFVAVQFVNIAIFATD
jgi:cation:H+ antiporter